MSDHNMGPEEEPFRDRLVRVETQLGAVRDNEARMLTVMDGLTRTVVPRREIDARFDALGEKIDRGFQNLQENKRSRMTTILTVLTICVAVPGAAFAGGVPLYHLFKPSTVKTIQIPPRCPPREFHDKVTGRCHA